MSHITHSGLINRHAGHDFCALMDLAAHNGNDLLPLIQRHISYNFFGLFRGLNRIIHLLENTVFPGRRIGNIHFCHYFLNDVFYHALINWHEFFLPVCISSVPAAS